MMKARPMRVLFFLVVLVVVYLCFSPLLPLLKTNLSPSSSHSPSNEERGDLSTTRNGHLLPGAANSSLGGGGDVSTIDIDNVSALLEAARAIQDRHGVVFFCMINDAYFDFASSWCCNTAPLPEVHRRVLFLTTDVATGRRLKSLWANVSVVALRTTSFSGFRKYSQAGHVRMMTERTRFILRMLEAGVQLLLFEVDCLWLKNPLPLVLPHLHSHPKEGHTTNTTADIVATRVAGKSVTAAGFLLLTPTKATLRFWGQLTHDLDVLVGSFKAQENSRAVPESGNEQEYFTLLEKRKFAGIRIVHLPEAVFPDGKWYSLPPDQRDRSRPAIINNNWVVGKDGKRDRARAFGHWFWDEAGQRCNATAVKRLFHGPIG